MKRLFLMVTIFIFALAACGGGGNEEVAESEEVVAVVETAVIPPTPTAEPIIVETAVTEPTVIPEPTETPAPLAVTVPETDTEAADDAADDSDEEASTEEAVENVAEANGNCIVGTWRVSNFSDYLVASMTANADLAVTAETTGDLLIIFNEDEMSMVGENFVVTITLAGQTVPVAVDADGTATYSSDGTTISNVVTTYDSTASSGATAVSINLGMLTAAGADGGTVSYTCNANVMIWSGPFAIPLEFARVDS